MADGKSDADAAIMGASEVAAEAPSALDSRMRLLRRNGRALPAALELPLDCDCCCCDCC
jgi:hypothetical protein